MDSLPYKTDTVTTMLLTIVQQAAAMLIVIGFLVLPQLFLLAVSFYAEVYMEDIKSTISSIDTLIDRPAAIKAKFFEIILLHRDILTYGFDFFRLVYIQQ